MFSQHAVDIQSYVFPVILACLPMAVSPSVTRIGRGKMFVLRGTAAGTTPRNQNNFTFSRWDELQLQLQLQL